MYTELIFGAELKKDTPAEVIETLRCMVDGKPNNISESLQIFKWIFCRSSYYFGVSEPVCRMWFDNLTDSWRISTRSNLKNYKSEIEQFLDWIKPYIRSGSGNREFYAIVMYEDSETPTIHYLHND